MTIAEFKQSVEYQRLTENEQAFLLEYVSNGFNVQDAAQKAFDTGSPRSAYVYGRRVITRPRVEAALRCWGGANEITEEEIYSDLRSAMKQNKSLAAKVSAIKLACQLKGLIEDDSGSADVGDQGRAGLLPPKIIELLAAKINETPVSRILQKMGVDAVTIEAEGKKQLEEWDEEGGAKPQE